MVRAVLGRLIPRTMFGRLFLSHLALSFLLSGFVCAWFFDRSYLMLDQEAGVKLLNSASLVAGEVGNLGEDSVSEYFENRFSHARNPGWIQNAYFLDMREKQSRLVASFSLEEKDDSPLMPPTVDEIEEMVDEGLDKLEEGLPFFPNPFSHGEQRRFKVVLVPRLDSDGFLESVVGLEADMQYLDLFIALKGTVVRAIGFSIIISVLLSALLARGFSRRIEVLVQGLEDVASRKPVDSADLGIAELEALRRGIGELGRRIDARDSQLREVFQEKLDDLSLTGSAIAHEVRNPLSAMDLHLSLIRRRFNPQGSEQEPFREISQQIAQMKSLVERFLQFSGKVGLSPSVFPLRPLLDEVVQNCLKLFGPIELQNEIPADLTVRADREVFGRCFENLLKNSWEAKGKGLSIRGTAVRKEDKLEITFSDNGPGVHPSLVPKLFAPFSSGREGGHGIGLALVRKLVSAHEGLIHYRPGPEGGAQFIIEVPAAT